MVYYLYAFLAAILVDVIPFIGPPAWTVMVYFQMKHGLNVWLVLIAGVSGSTIGRYLLSMYTPLLSDRFINVEKKNEMEFVGERLSANTWHVQLFVLLYTMIPLPSTPLFTAAGIARINTFKIIPAFLIGKFTSDMIMVLSGAYAAKNMLSIAEGVLSWKSIIGAGSGVLILFAFLCIDWKLLLVSKKLRWNFKIWK